MPVEEMKTQWPPDYAKIFLQRQQTLFRIQDDMTLVFGAIEYYRTRPVEFIMDWGVTYDPRNAQDAMRPTLMPFVLFDRQVEFIYFLMSLIKDQASGLVEKSRDIGATWLSCAFSVWLWLFVPGAAIGWGSRKESLVDKLGDPDSIFEKIRLFLDYIPRFFWPSGFSVKRHCAFMRVINPANGATITGEAGDNIGRGGRKLIYFKDEAQPLTAKVLTPSGFKLMRDIKVSDDVIGLNGRSQKVTAINPCGEHPCFRFHMIDGSFVDCSHNHLWTLENVLGKKRVVTLPAHEVEKKHLYVSPKGQKHRRYRLPMPDPVEFEKGPELPLDPYIVGALLGDGSVSNVPKHRPKFTSADIEVVQCFEKLLPKACCIRKSSGKYEYNLCDVDGRRGQGKISRMSLAIMDAGIAGHRAEEKFIPDTYKFASVSDRLSLLQGLMDTDGSSSGNTVLFVTSSLKLANDVKFIVRSLGGLAYHYVKPDKRDYLPMQRITVILPDGMIPFRLPRKIRTLRKRKQATARTIMSVEKLPVQEVKCITVENSDGLYLTDDFVPTHNSAHYERPKRIEAALSETTNVQVDMSSVNGTGNIFHRRRQSGKIWRRGKNFDKSIVRIFIFDWKDHPGKDQVWYEQKKAKARAEGLLHIFAQEIDRDYSAAIERVVIPNHWVKAAIDAHIRLNFDTTGMIVSALDVAEEGGDKNCYTKRKGVVLTECKTWGEPDVGVSTKRAIHYMLVGGSTNLQFDSIGVGAAVKSTVNHLLETKQVKGLEKMQFIKWIAGASPLYPKQRIIPKDKSTPTNEDFFENLKAQAWWNLRNRFERTYKAVMFQEEYPEDLLISIPSTLPELYELESELSQPTYKTTGKGKIVIEKKPDGATSPNRADSVVMNYWPIQPKRVII